MHILLLVDHLSKTPVTLFSINFIHLLWCWWRRFMTMMLEIFLWVVILFQQIFVHNEHVTKLTILGVYLNYQNRFQCCDRCNFSSVHNLYITEKTCSNGVGVPSKHNITTVAFRRVCQYLTIPAAILTRADV